MKLTECFDLVNKFNVIYSQMDIDDASLYIYMPNNNMKGKCQSLDDYKTFVHRLGGPELREFLLNNYDKFDFEWNKYHPEYDEHYRYIAEASLKTEFNGLYETIRLELHLG